MFTKTTWLRLLAITLLLGHLPLLAIINPFNQPMDQVKIHRNVVILAVTARDEKGRFITAKVVRVTKGDFAPTEVRIGIDSDAEEALYNLAVGQTLVAFVGKTQKRFEDELLCYAGAGTWFLGKTPDMATPERWQWSEVGDPNALGGIFNGSSARLAELMVDLSEGHDFFPAKPSCRFSVASTLGSFEQPVGGVALVDVDGDARLDAIACTGIGLRVWLQRPGLVFEDATTALGLGTAKAKAIAAADLDGSGRRDLLLDGVLWTRGTSGFTRSDRVPAIPGLINATLADLDGDGWPDVLAATSSGVRVYLNPGKAAAPFIDATARMGLEAKECGAGIGALVTASSDFDGQGQTTLFLGTPTGLLLVRGADGKFHPRAIPALTLAPADDGQRCGGAVIGALWESGAMSILVPRHHGFAMLVPQGERVLDFIGACNETSESSSRQLWTLAEDLDADGEVDIYTASGKQGVEDVCHLNRGYGSFMRPMKQDSSVFPMEGYGSGSWGVAAGDVDGDGASDLLLGGADGVVRLLHNGSLALRTDLEESAGVYLAKVAKARIISIELAGAKGLIGASLALRDAQGQVLARRQVNGNGVAGSWSQGPIQLVVREAGDYTLSVRRSDGRITSTALKVDANQPLLSHLTVAAP